MAVRFVRFWTALHTPCHSNSSGNDSFSKDIVMRTSKWSIGGSSSNQRQWSIGNGANGRKSTMRDRKPRKTQWTIGEQPTRQTKWSIGS